MCSGGRCVPATCTTLGQPCDATHVCCDYASVSGTCCSNSDCDGGACLAGRCTSCPEVVADGADLYVDALAGNDAVASGAGVAGCKFKTLGRALEVAGTHALTIHVAGHATLSAEAFPLYVVAATEIKSDGGVVAPGPGQTAVVVTGDNALLYGLSVDGRGVARRGVIVRISSDTDVAHLIDIAVRRMTGDGLRVQRGRALAYNGPPFEATGNGTGVHVVGGTAEITFSYHAGRATRISGNAGQGILVEGTGAIMLSGNAGDLDNDQGFRIEGNRADGVVLRADPARAPPPSTIRGVGILDNGGDGVRVVGGSRLALTGSVVTGNHGNGVHVVDWRPDGGPGSAELSGIDLGGAMPGENALQSSVSPYAGVGVCLDVSANAGTLAARGNAFFSQDCTQDAGVLSSSAQCAGARAVGVTQDGNVIDVTLCSY